MDRRTFLRNTALTSAGIALAGPVSAMAMERDFHTELTRVMADSAAKHERVITLWVEQARAEEDRLIGLYKSLEKVYDTVSEYRMPGMSGTQTVFVERITMRQESAAQLMHDMDVLRGIVSSKGEPVWDGWGSKYRGVSMLAGPAAFNPRMPYGCLFGAKIIAESCDMAKGEMFAIGQTQTEQGEPLYIHHHFFLEHLA